MIALLMLLGLTACAPQVREEPSGQAYEVYYLNRDETKVVPEKRYLEETGQDEQIGQLLKALQETPEDATLKPCLGTLFSVNGYRVEEGQLNLDVSEDYKKLSPTTEVLVRASLVRTLAQAEGINHVLMSVGGQGLTDSLGGIVGPMTADAFIDNAGDEINAYEMVTLRLFFANEEGNGLVETSRTVVYNSNISLEKLVVENLVKGPDVEGAYPVFDSVTKVLGVTVKDGTCYVNFDSGFMNQTYNVTADVTVYSLVNSLVELSNINKVQIAVNGKTDLVYRESFNLANVYERNLELTKTES